MPQVTASGGGDGHVGSVLGLLHLAPVTALLAMLKQETAILHGPVATDEDVVACGRPEAACSLIASCTTPEAEALILPSDPLLLPNITAGAVLSFLSPSLVLEGMRSPDTKVSRNPRDSPPLSFSLSLSLSPANVLASPWGGSHLIGSCRALLCATPTHAHTFSMPTPTSAHLLRFAWRF
jgi:hypothetical protein